MRISVIIPIYNGSKYLDKLIKSFSELQKNTYEFIFVDDCSSDNTLEKLKELELHNQRIRVYCNDRNHGPGYSRNFGIKKAKYEYVAFLDADDSFVNDTLDNLDNSGKKQETDVLLFGYAANILKKEKVNIILPGIDGFLSSSELTRFVEKWEFHPLAGSSSNKVYKKSFIENNHIEFPLDWKIWEDYIFNLSLFALKPKVYVVNKPLFVYNLDDNNPCSLHNIVPEDIEKHRDRSIQLFNKYLSCLSETKTAIKYTMGHSLTMSLLRIYNYSNTAWFSAKQIQNFININKEIFTTYRKCNEKMFGKKKDRIFFWLLKRRYYFLVALTDKLIIYLKKF